VLSNHRTHTGNIDLSDLARRWRLLEQLYAATETVVAAHDRRIFSARTFDQGQTAGHRVYASVERYLNIARDNHQALVALIASPHGITTFAPWNLLRPEFEASFYAAWVLDPDDSMERRRRALRLELLDQRDHNLYYEDVMRMSDGPAVEELADGFAALSSSLETARQRNETVYAREAAQLDLPYPRVAGVSVLHELGKLSTCDQAPQTDFLLRATWRGLSGIQHGRASAVMRASNLRDRQETKHGVRGLLDVDDNAFLNAANATTCLHMEAVRLLLLRSQP
jgi:hypothetical protein